MRNPLVDGILQCRDDRIGLDGLLLPDAPPLFDHQRHVFRTFPRYQNRWLEAARGAGKSYIMGRFFIGEMILWPGSVVLTVAPSFRQAKHPLTYLLHLIRYGGPFLASQVERVREDSERMEIVLKNGSKIKAIPSTDERIHGERCSDLLLSEFRNIPGPTYLGTLAPMAAVRLLPDKPNTLTIESSAGFQGQASWNERSRWVELLAAGDISRVMVSVDLDDLTAIGYPMEWELVNATRAADEDLWQQAYNNRWPSFGGTLYSYAILGDPRLRTAVPRRLAREGRTYVFGIDVAQKPGGDDSALCVMELDLTIPAPVAIVFLKAWNGVSAVPLAVELMPIIERFDPAIISMDIRGGGYNVVEALRPLGILLRDSPQAGRRLIVPYTSTPEMNTKTHMAFQAACENTLSPREEAASVRTIAFPQDTDDSLHAETSRLMQVGIKQACDLNAERLDSGWSRIVSTKKRDMIDSIIYAYAAVRQLLDEREQQTPKRRDRGSPIVSSGLAAALLGDPYGPYFP